MTVDRRALDVVLAMLQLEQRELAELMGYRRGYIANVFNGSAKASPALRAAFGEVLAELIFGSDERARDSFPAAPLTEFIARRAAQATNKRRFYDELGVSPQAWSKRDVVTGALVDRVCCALGVHPSAIYGRQWDEQEAW